MSGPWAPSATPFSVRTMAASRRSAALGFTDLGSVRAWRVAITGIMSVGEAASRRATSAGSIDAAAPPRSPDSADPRRPRPRRVSRRARPRRAANHPSEPAFAACRRRRPTGRGDACARGRVTADQLCADDRSRPHAVDDDGHRRPALDRTAGVRVEHEVGPAIDHRDLVRERMRRRQHAAASFDVERRHGQWVVHQVACLDLVDDLEAEVGEAAISRDGYEGHADPGGGFEGGRIDDAGGCSQVGLRRDNGRQRQGRDDHERKKDHPGDDGYP